MRDSKKTRRTAPHAANGAHGEARDKGTGLAHHARLVWLLTRRQLAARTVGSLGGPIWILAQPLVTLGVYWYVFEFGLRVGASAGLPFVLYYLAGFVPWLSFSEALAGSTNAVLQNQYLVKKTVFPTELLAIVQIAAAGVTHLILLAPTVTLALFMGVAPSWTMLGVVYYFICLNVFALGLGWLVSSLNVFNRDVGQLITVALGLWFWLTPIVWPFSALSGEAREILALNPLYYVINGYRQSLFQNIPFWSDPLSGLRFWLLALATLALGMLVFKKLKPEFADAL